MKYRAMYKGIKDCGHDHRSLRTAEKCRRRKDYTHIVVFNEKTGAWRGLTGQELRSLKKD